MSAGYKLHPQQLASSQDHSKLPADYFGWWLWEANKLCFFFFSPLLPFINCCHHEVIPGASPCAPSYWYFPSPKLHSSHLSPHISWHRGRPSVIYPLSGLPVLISIAPEGLVNFRITVHAVMGLFLSLNGRPHRGRIGVSFCSVAWTVHSPGPCTESCP